MAGEVLVFGKSGQIARALAGGAAPEGVRLTFAGRARCDLQSADPALLIQHLGPVAVINAAAYTAVDKAESEPEAAFRLNRDAPAAMAQACAKLDIPFVHVSTDYVFAGDKAEPYVETDPTGPLGVYGASKLEGEQAVMAAGGRWSIVRTAWVVSSHPPNFVLTIKRLAEEKEVVRVVDDQVGRPTHAQDIAAVCLAAALRGDPVLRGIFHLAGADDASWADVAEYVFELMEQKVGRRPVLERITTAEYPTRARRPANSRLDTSKLESAIGWRPRPWRETVELCLG